MSAPTVSVVLTAHNYGRFLDQSIRSVLAQTFQDFELVVVDDGSTDETPEIIARLSADPRVTALTLSGVGLAAACNRGIRRSHGAYVMRLDADDFLEPQALAVLAGVLNRTPEADLVYPDFYTVDEQGRALGRVRVPPVQDGARLLDHNPLAGGALYRRSCFDALGGYNEGLRYQEDFEFWLRFIERFRAYGVGLPLLAYRRHGGSMSRNRAPRSAARRYVKRCFVESRGLLADERVAVVIPTVWPGSSPRPEALLLRPLAGSIPLALAVESARAAAGGGRVLVVTDHHALRDAAAGAGAEVVAGSSRTFIPAAPDDRVELAWLRELVSTLAQADGAVPTVLLLASPYCPLRHPERLREAVDTLVIHGCDLVLSMDGETVVPWRTGADWPTPVAADQKPAGAHGREAGELLAVRASWLLEARSPAEAKVGYIELLHPEGWRVTDEASWQTCLTLRDEAAAIQVPVSAYLRAGAGAGLS